MKEYECVPYNGKMINSNGRQCNQLQQEKRLLWHCVANLKLKHTRKQKIMTEIGGNLGPLQLFCILFFHANIAVTYMM